MDSSMFNHRNEMQSKKRKFGKVCCSKECSNKNYNSTEHFFTFPVDPKKAELWLLACGRQDLLHKKHIVHKSHRLCSKHFEERMFRSTKKRKLLRDDSVPTLFMNSEISPTERTITDSEPITPTLDLGLPSTSCDTSYPPMKVAVCTPTDLFILPIPQKTVEPPNLDQSQPQPSNIINPNSITSNSSTTESTPQKSTLEDRANSKPPKSEDEEVFVNFVAAAIRNLRSEARKRELKRKIQRAIIETEELDEADQSGVFSPPSPITNTTNGTLDIESSPPEVKMEFEHNFSL